ncbi:MAG: LemA family protein [Lachnospiraceae bacterium]|nr:LemA family protein [Lachnospiraceae bacterium]
MNPVVIVICVVLLIIVGWIILTINGIRRMQVKISEAEADIDVALNKRFDVLTKMLDVAKSYLGEERDIILKSIQMRAAMSLEQKGATGAAMENAQKQLLAVGESYPQLGSTNQFKQLQIAIMDTEEHLQAARRVYNSNISRYNQMCVSFPNSVVAALIGASRREFFKIDDSKRQDVDMKF